MFNIWECINCIFCLRANETLYIFNSRRELGPYYNQLRTTRTTLFYFDK